MSVYSLKSYFPSSIDLCIPAWLEILKGYGIYNGRSPVLGCIANMVSESPRTKYSGEPEPYWLLSKTKAWLEI